jgi:hypothetical protein
MKQTSVFLVACAGLVLAVLPSLGQDKVDAVTLVRKHIDGMANGKGAGEVMLQSAPAIKGVFADHQLVLVRFRVFPIARVMPEGLRASNIFAVNKEGKIEHLKDVKAMHKFFHANHPVVKNETDAKKVLAAWLTLTPEFHQDGMFKFEVLDKEFTLDTTGELKVSGRATVMQGGNGELKAVLQIDKEGKIAKADETAKIRPGPRPICQATKLLDADPLVRRICEQDLLIMGLAAREYLMEQRARATPELRDAIDRVWQQIQKNGW